MPRSGWSVPTPLLPEIARCWSTTAATVTFQIVERRFSQVIEKPGSQQVVTADALQDCFCRFCPFVPFFEVSLQISNDEDEIGRDLSANFVVASRIRNAE